MRVFLSAFSGFTLAVPMDAVAAMMLYNQKTEKLIQYDQKSRNTYISLPRLFKLDEEAVHGIILREWNSKVNKVVLLTAGIKRDIEIPDKEFHPIPKSLGTLRFSKVFSGIKFSDNPILLLNIEQLTQLIQDEQYVINTKNNFPEKPRSEEPPPKQLPAEQPLPKKQPPEQQPPTVISEPSPPPPELESQIEQPPEEPPAEKLPPEEPPLAVVSEPSPPPLESESQIEQPAEEPPPEQPPPAVVSEVEPLTDLLVLEELPPEQPPPPVASELEPLTDLLVLEELPSEELPEEPLVEEEPPEEPLVEETPEELLVEEPPEELLVEEPPSAEVEPLTDLLVLSELP